MMRFRLALKSRAGSIRHALGNRAYPHPPKPTIDRVTVAAVQMQLELLDDGAQFANKLYHLVRQAVERDAQLIVFPEYAWLPLLGLLPATRDLVADGVTLANADRAMIASLLRALAPTIKTIFETTGSELAARFGVYLMPGTTITVDKAGHLYNTAYLFGPDGALIGAQNKLHLTPLETEWMSRGSELQVFTLPFARVALPVCMDYSYWETTRAATLRGADILLGFSAEEKASEFFLAMRGIASRLQESHAFGIQACCVTHLFGLNFGGPSYIAAPLGMHRAATIFLARTSTSNVEQVISAKLDLAHLREFRRATPRDFNLELYRKYLPRLYAAWRAQLPPDGKRRII